MDDHDDHIERTKWIPLVHREEQRPPDQHRLVEPEIPPGPVLLRVSLEHIKLDPHIYPPALRKRHEAKKQFELLLAGKELPPVKIEKLDMPQKKKRYVLVDGYPIWKAHQLRARRHKEGLLPNLQISPAMLQTIPAVVVEVPDDLKQSPRDRIRRFYEERPGYPENKAAKELGLDLKTIKKHAGDLIKKWKADRRIIISVSSKKMSRRAVARALKMIWPWALLSQTTVNRIANKVTSACHPLDPELDALVTRILSYAK